MSWKSRISAAFRLIQIEVLLDAERRQRSPIRIIMSGAGGATVVDSAVRLLPFTFQL